MSIPLAVLWRCRPLHLDLCAGPGAGMARRGRKPKGKGPAKRREPLHPLSNVDHARNNNDSEAQEEQVGW